MSITPFKRILCANRGEIGPGLSRVGPSWAFARWPSSPKDRVHLHRYRPTRRSWSQGWSRVAAYLAETRSSSWPTPRDRAIHPGYGLPVRARVVRAQCRDARHRVHRPTPEAIDALGDKIAGAQDRPRRPVCRSCRARPSRCAQLEAAARLRHKPATRCWSRPRPGRRGAACASCERPASSARALEARALGGAQGLRRRFGLSRELVVRPKHIESKILGDNPRQPRALFERDCSVQRRYQKSSEYAPAWSLPQALRAKLADRRAQGRALRQVQQRRHGSSSCRRGRHAHYFHRGQPAHPGRHTVHEVITGRDLVQRRSRSRRATGCRPGDRDRSQAAIDRRRRDPGARHRRGIPRTTSCRHRQDFAALPARPWARHPLDDGWLTSARGVSPYYDRCSSRSPPPGSVELRAPQGDPLAARVPASAASRPNIHFSRERSPTRRSSRQAAHHLRPTRRRRWRQITARRDRARRILRYVATTRGQRTLHRARKPKPPTAVLNQDAIPHCRCGDEGGAAARQQADPRPARARRCRALAQGNRRVPPGPTPPGATPTSRCWRRGCARSNLARIAPATAAHLQPTSSRWRCGAARPSTFAYALVGRGPLAAPGTAAQAGAQHHVPDAGARRPRRRLHQLPRRRRAGGSSRRRRARAWTCSASSTRSRRRQHAVAIEAAQKSGKIVETGSVNRRRLRSGAHEFDLKYYVTMAKEICRRGTHLTVPSRTWRACSSARRDHPGQGAQGCGRRAAALHMTTTAGNAISSYLAAIDAGVEVVDGAVGIMAGMTSQRRCLRWPSRWADRRAIQGQYRGAREAVALLGRPVREWYAPFGRPEGAGRRRVRHEIRAASTSNLRAQAEALGVGAAWQVRQARVRRGQPPVRRHSKVDAELEGRRRHGRSGW